MNNKIANLWNKLSKGNNSATRPRSQLLDVGFHGDLYLIQLVDSIIHNCSLFIETGTNVGSTLAYVAKSYPSIRCLSCEPDKLAFEGAVENVSGLTNVTIHNVSSQDFIEIIRSDKKNIFNESVVFWLDAHGYGFEWPLKEEIRFITDNFTKAYIFIDDFKVPGLDCFKYDQYKGQVCSFDYIKCEINKESIISLYYPAYTERTSNVHPLTGWGLIVFGENIKIPLSLKGKIKGAEKNSTNQAN